MLASGPKGFFTIPHFDGYAAVLIELKVVGKRKPAGGDHRRLVGVRPAETRRPVPRPLTMAAPDDELPDLSDEELVAEVLRLRQGIREHRVSTGHDLCWHHPALWGLLPESTDPIPTVPEWPEFMRGCIRYRQSLDSQLGSAPRTSEEFGPDPSC